MPEELPGAERLKAVDSGEPDAGGCSIGGGAAPLVENGRDVTVHGEPEPGSPDDDRVGSCRVGGDPGDAAAR